MSNVVGQFPRKNGRKNKWGCGCIVIPLIALLVIGFFFFSHMDRERQEAIPFEKPAKAQAFWDHDYQPAALSGEIAPYPGLAPDSNASIHGDGYQSDVHPFAAPTGDRVTIRSRKAGNGMRRQCSTFTFRRDGKIITMCGGLTGFRMVLIDPDSLEALAYHDLPMRPSAFQSLVYRDLSYTFSDSSGGAYFVLDDKDRVIVGDPDQQIKRLVAEQIDGEWTFRVEKQWDMKPYVPNDCLHYDNWFPSGECDAITTVVPGPDGRLWWTTRFGRLGTLDPENGKVHVVRLRGEEIQNALAVDAGGVYVLSDHAQYAFRADQTGKPQQLWRFAYDRGSGRKAGAINQGSGTTPTLLGTGYITFTDNADGGTNLVVLRRGELKAGQQRQVCKIPIFEGKPSATENSMIGWNRSIIVENNAGYTNAVEHRDWNAMAGGVVRVDIRKDESGCDIIWDSPLVVPSVVPKLSLKTGIAYFYSFDQGKDGEPDWYIAGLDFGTGNLVQKIPTGKGTDWNNNWSAIAIGPDGSLYAGTASGFLQVRPEAGLQTGK